MKDVSLTIVGITLLTIALLIGCNTSIKKGASLDALLVKTTFLHTSISGDSVTELVFDNTYKIVDEDGCVYHLLREFAVDGNAYIFVIISEGGSGSGVFRDLHVVDKKTHRTVDTVVIGDRSPIEQMRLIDKQNDILSIRFSTKGDAYTSSEKVEKTYRINGSGLLEEVMESPE